ncbi:MAG: LptF/LptG family permease [Planctomycetota bacterium]
MPLRLWRYISADFWRLLVIATAVLVTVIAFAATIRPLADGKLTPLDALTFMGLAMIPMLIYAVPFAAGFAATLVYHRLAQDNELTAAHAGGIGHRGVLAPALIAGVLLTGVMGTISDQAIPRFLRSMEDYLRLDIAEWMIVQLGAGQSFEFGGTMLAAESVQKLDPDAVPGAEDARSVIALFEAALLFLDDDKTARTAATAERAFLVVRPTQTTWTGLDAGGSASADGRPKFGAVVSVIAQNYRGAGDDQIIQSRDQFRYDMAIPPVISDDPKFFTFARLQTLKQHPERFDFVDQVRHALAIRSAAVEMLQEVDDQIRATGRAVLTTSEGLSVAIEGARLNPGLFLSRRVIPAEPGQPIRIEITTPGDPDAGTPDRVEHLTAAVVRLNSYYQEELTQTRPVARLEMEHVATTGRTSDDDIRRAAETDQAIVGVRARRIVSELEAPNRFSELRAMPIPELLEATRYLTEEPHRFAGAIEASAHLRRIQGKVLREISANEHERVAMSLVGLVMILTGAVVAMRLKDALPLTVYLWAFFPALASILTISMGKQLIHEFGVIGVPVLWAGVFVPLGYTFLTYRSVAKH